jgi:RimJ/RimL family protein N-acetyltransferase
VSMAAQSAVPDSTVFTLVLNATGAPIGSLSYLANVPTMRRVELGSIWVTPAVQGSGVVREAVFLMLQHAFGVLGYRCVYLGGWVAGSRRLLRHSTLLAYEARYAVAAATSHFAWA